MFTAPRLRGMGTLECVRQVEALSIAETDKATILGGAAKKVLALP